MLFSSHEKAALDGRLSYCKIADYAAVSAGSGIWKGSSKLPP